MTSTRSLAASIIVLSVSVGAGCAVIPGTIGDDICLNCASPDSGDASFSSDAGLVDVMNPVVNGTRSSLCIGDCNPKSSSSTPDNPLACADAGAGSTYDGGTTNGGDLACRVILTPTLTEAVKCEPAGAHGDGASCNTGADCMPGYECVGTPGACHHYCCSETFCTSSYYANFTGRYFCDVQSETASPSVQVPVCMLAQPCDLLLNGCGDGMTCTLVDPLNSDLTSCVLVGNAQVGDSCEIEHCAADMICVGPYGQRTCRQLCNSTHTCTYPQQCDGQWSQLAKFNVGICQ